jgi:excisionase family DNA binding protein
VSAHPHPTTPYESPVLLNARDVARLLGCSWRHVFRLADRGEMPWGVKVGRLRRWDRASLEAWIASGCKPVRKPVAV